MGGSDDAASGASDGHPDNPAVWKRWVDGNDNLHLHSFCSIVPQLERREGWPFLGFTTEGENRPTFTDPDTGEEREFVFVGGLPRQILRHTPLVVLLATVVLLVGAELSGSVQGVSELLPIFTEELAILTLWVFFLPILFYLFYAVGVIGGGDASIPGVSAFYGLPLGLLLGVSMSIVLVFTAASPSALPPNIVFVSGYLLTLLIGGQLFYDTILRTEHLFVHLPEIQIVNDEEGYYRLLSELDDSLSTSVLGVSAASIFGLLFAVQFAAVWLVGNGPQDLGFWLNIVVNTALNVVLVVATFQFIVVIRYTNLLFADDSQYRDVLGYEPFHVDGRGGYRDLGRYAIRFNGLIGLGALYLLYRLYVTGTRALPPEGLAAFGDRFEMLLWVINYAGPMVVFGLVLCAWAYFGFWSMHMKMVREKDRIAWAYQGDPKMAGDAGAGVPIDELDSGPAYQYIDSAPEWPVNPQRLTGIISGAFLPLLLPLPGLIL